MKLKILLISLAIVSVSESTFARDSQSVERVECATMTGRRSCAYTWTKDGTITLLVNGKRCSEFYGGYTNVEDAEKRASEVGGCTVITTSRYGCVTQGSMGSVHGIDIKGNKTSTSFTRGALADLKRIGICHPRSSELAAPVQSADAAEETHANGAGA